MINFVEIVVIFKQSAEFLYCHWMIVLRYNVGNIFYMGGMDFTERGVLFCRLFRPSYKTNSEYSGV